MTYARVVLAGFVGGLVAIVVYLAWKASKETGKSIPASIVDVPKEAQQVASDVRVKATDARLKALEKAAAEWEAVKEKEVALAKHLPGRRGATETTEETVSTDGGQPAAAL